LAIKKPEVVSVRVAPRRQGHPHPGCGVLAVEHRAIMGGYGLGVLLDRAKASIQEILRAQNALS
jgi:hypothetical protein